MRSGTVSEGGGVEIAVMVAADYDEVAALWRSAEGVTLREADSREGIAGYLARNPGSSFVARDGGRVVGAVLGGHDGRRGYLHHLAVAASHRRRGIARALAGRVITTLAAAGIRKCHLFVEADNAGALGFWRRCGWQERDDLVMLSFTDPAHPGA